MKKTIILIVILFIAIIGVSSLYFSRLNKSQNASERYIATIPASASLLLSFNNDSSFYDLFKDYKGFGLIFGKEELKELESLKEAFLKNTAFSTVVDQQPVYLSFHAEEDSINWLLSLPLQGTNDPEILANNLNPSISITPIQDSVSTLYEVTIPNVSRKGYASIQPENVMFTFSRPLLEQALDENSDHLSELFLEKFKENNLRNNSPFQLYVNHENLKALLSSLQRKTTSVSALFESLNGVSMLDLNYKSDVLMFSGTSSMTATDSAYLSLFLTQDPVAHQLKNWIPANVAEVTSYGISDYSSFHDGLVKILEKRKDIDQLREQMRYIENENNVVIDDELLKIWGNEFAKLTLRSGEKIGIIAIRDSLEYAKIADKISTIDPDSSIRHFDNSNLLYYSLGDPLQDFRRPYFTYAHGYLIVANHRQTLTDYLERLENQDLLIKEEDYMLYDRLQSTSSNFSLFIHRENSNRMTERNLNRPFQENYKNTENFGYNRFYAFSLQLSGNGDDFLVNLYGKFDEDSSLED